MRLYWRNLWCAVRGHPARPFQPKSVPRPHCSCGFRYIKRRTQTERPVVLRRNWGPSDLAEFRDGWAAYLTRV